MAVPCTALLTSTAPHSQALRITRRATPAPQLLSSIFSLNCLALTRTRLILSQRLVSQSTGTKEESVMAPQADSTRYLCLFGRTARCFVTQFPTFSATLGLVVR